MLDDETELGRFGYRQELERRLSGFGSFALSFSVISILTGAVSLYGFGLQHGGPAEMLFGWPLVSVMTLFVALSLAELASAYPTAGALYHWATLLGGRRIGWWVAWLNLIGQVGVIAGVDYAFSELLRPLFGLPDRRASVLGLYAAVLVSHGVINQVGVRLVDRLGRLSAWYHLVGTLIVVGALLLFAPLKPLSFLLRTHVAPQENGLSSSLAYACLVGLLQAQWTFTGYDASAHLSEETHLAQEAAPRGIVSAVVVSALAGFVLLVVVTLAIRDLDAAAGAPSAFAAILDAALGARLGGALVLLVVGAMWFCGLASVASNSRMLYAFARDGGTPAAQLLARVSPRHHAPVAAIWGCIAVAFLLAVWSGAYSVIVSISTIGLYASYGLPILLAIRARGQGRLERGPWTVGRWSTAVNLVAVTWVAFITVLFMLPPNQLTAYTFAGLLALLALYDLLRAPRRPPLAS